MALFSNSATRIQPYFGYRNGETLWITARALRSGKPKFENRGRLQAFRTMLSQFASREVAGLTVRMEIEQAGCEETHIFEAETDVEGFVNFAVPLPGGWPMPDHTSWEVVALHWRSEGEDHCVEGHILVPGSSRNLAVISDIDDTIIETGITGGLRQILRNWRRVLAELPEERLAVPGSDTFYGALGGGNVLGAQDVHLGERLNATHRAFFYISSSPWNLFSYLVTFQKMRGLPLGPLMLRDWGLDRETLGSSSHGAHKRRSMEKILAAFPDMRFALIGDDTQGDLTAYADVVADYPQRIAAIFIRSAGEALSSQEIAAKATIEAAGVPFWFGESYNIGQGFLRAAGLSNESEAAKIVETARHAPQEG
ncbi:MAG: phosphatase domain-containing protein [Alteripontixanthobacter sp.]